MRRDVLQERPQRPFTHTLLCDVLMSTYHCALVLYEVTPAETAQSAEWLRAVCNATISRRGGIKIFARSQREKNSVPDSLCPQSKIYRRESVSKGEAAGCRIFFKHRSNVWYHHHQ